MSVVSHIPLDENWLCRYLPPPDSDEAASAPFVTRLPDCVVYVPRDGWVLTCERRFELEPTRACVSYLLQVRDIPGPLDIFLRGERVGHIPRARGDFSLDVTDYVALDDNRIELRLALTAVPPGSRIGAIWLQPVLC